MTPQELKELAEFAAGELGGIFYDTWEYPADTRNIILKNVWVFPAETNDALCEPYINDFDLVEWFFQDNSFAPILKHLMEEKLEKEKANLVSDNENGYHFQIFKEQPHSEFPDLTVMELCGYGCDTENKFISFWLAVKELRGKNA